MWKYQSNISDTAYETLRTELAQSGCSIQSLKTTRHYIEEHLGIHIKEYHRCIDNCMVFIGKDLLRRNCRFCKAPRFFKKLNAPADNPPNEFFADEYEYLDLIPRATYCYIPLISRLKLLYANPESAVEMRYPKRLSEMPWAKNDDGVHEEGIRDIWDGQIMRHWKQRGFFSDERTVALHLSTDGVQLFRNSTQEVWPFLIMNLNLPPEEQYFQHCCSNIDTSRRTSCLLDCLQGRHNPEIWILSSFHLSTNSNYSHKGSLHTTVTLKALSNSKLISF